MRLRSLAGAILVAALLGPAPAAEATCVSAPDVVFCLPTGPGSVYLDGGDLSESCLYIKMKSPAPPEWPQGADSGGPYIFIRSKAWGNQPGHGLGYGYDYRFCDLLIPSASVGHDDEGVSVDVEVAEQSLHIDVPLPVPPPAGSIPVPVPLPVSLPQT